MIQESLPYCDEYRIGLVSGMKKNYTREDVEQFVKDVKDMAAMTNPTAKIIWKDSVTKFLHTNI